MWRGGSGSRTPEGEGGTMPEAPQWARVRGDRNFGTRRGAWHELLRLTPDEAIIPVRPHSWSVVPRPSDAVNMPLSWGSKYAVCPSCGERAPLRGQPTEMPCPRCKG